MKSLKKTLSLVLVLVMVLGMFGIASAFTDDDKIQYKEAVEVMTGIGAINGYTDGSFLPKGNINRAEAAKMVAFTILGADIANTLTSSSSTFTDMSAPSYKWAIPYVEYLARIGVVNGSGGGKYSPEGNVTGYELGKMLLCALGYGAKNEYVGSGWDLQVAIDGRSYGIYDGRAADANPLADPTSREEAALYCFNALEIGKVSYSSVFGEYSPVTHSVKNEDGIVVQVVSTIHNTVYPTLKKVDMENGDDFGRPVSRQWTYKGGPISTVFSASPIATFKTAVTQSVAFNTFGMTSTNVVNSVYVNGAATPNVPLDRANTKPAEGFGGPGSVTELYKIPTSTGYSYVIVVIDNFLAQVTKVTAAKAATATAAAVPASVELTIYSATAAGVATAVTEVSYLAEGYTLGQFVVVNAVAPVAPATKPVVKAIAEANVAEALMTGYSTTTVTAGGTTYTKSSRFVTIDGAKNVETDPLKMGWTTLYNYFTDANGILLGTSFKEVVSSDYVYIGASSYVYSAGDILNPSALAAKATATFTDGRIEVIDLTLTKSTDAAGKTIYLANIPQANGTTAQVTLPATAASTPANTWFTYVQAEDGTYSLGTLNESYAKVAEVAELNGKATTVIGGKYTTSATEHTLVSVSGVVTSFKGFPNSKITIANKVLYTYSSAASASITGVYAAGQADAGASLSYALAVAYNGSNAVGQSWTFVVDGAAQTYTITSATAAKVAVGGVYDLDAVSTGVYSAKDPIPTKLGVVGLADATFFITTGADGTDAGNWTFASGAAVYNAVADDANFAKADAIRAGDTVVFVADASNVVAVAFITARAAG